MTCLEASRAKGHDLIPGSSGFRSLHSSYNINMMVLAIDCLCHCADARRPRFVAPLATSLDSSAVPPPTLRMPVDIGPAAPVEEHPLKEHPFCPLISLSRSLHWVAQSAVCIERTLLLHQNHLLSPTPHLHPVPTQRAHVHIAFLVKPQMADPPTSPHGSSSVNMSELLTAFREHVMAVPNTEVEFIELGELLCMNELQLNFCCKF